MQGPHRFDLFSSPSEVETAARAALAGYREDLARFEREGGEPRVWMPTLRLAIKSAERILASGLEDNIIVRDEEADLRCDKMAELSRALNRADLAVGHLDSGDGPDAAAALRGDVRIGYHTEVDDTDQPFCLFAPFDYDPTKRYPLMVRLHGMWYPEIEEDGWCIQSYEWDREFVRYAPRGGFIELYPYGRLNEGYRDAGLRDVLDTMALAEEFFSIDLDRVYIMGSSMGAAGAWRIAAEHRERFAAAAFVVGIYDQALAGKLRDLPVMFHYGEKDAPERVSSPQETAELLRGMGATVEVVAHPDSGHRIETTDYQLSYYRFFARHRRG